MTAASNTNMADAAAQAAEWKGKGNAALQQEKFEEAIECYTKVRPPQALMGSRLSRQ